MADTEAQIDELYAAPLEEFTAGRNALAKQLRDGGDSKAASKIKKLTKPTRAAWLVNQLARRKRREVKALLKTGERLRELQQGMLDGSVDPDRMRAEAAKEQEQVGSLLKVAESIGSEHGVGAQILDRVGDTLQAASADAEVAEAVELGRLDRERRAAGFGVAGTVAAPPTGSAKKGDADQKAERAAQAQARRRKQAERKLASAEKRVERERTAVDRAEAALAEREQRLRDAERDSSAARRELDSL